MCPIFYISLSGLFAFSWMRYGCRAAASAALWVGFPKARNDCANKQPAAAAAEVPIPIGSMWVDEDEEEDDNCVSFAGGNPGRKTKLN